MFLSFLKRLLLTEHCKADYGGSEQNDSSSLAIYHIMSIARSSNNC